MIDRGMIKWQPFDSCFSSRSIVKSVQEEKNKIFPPILSNEQIAFIETKIMDAYNLQSLITMTYYFNGNIIKETGKISSVHFIKKEIVLNNKFIYFGQIVSAI